jgi:glycosyltransferase involved in cell wall biosynthesis
MKDFDSIVCIGQTPWEGDFQKAIVQLMGEMAARHRILYVDYQYTLKDLIMGLAKKQAVPVGTLTSRTKALTVKKLAGGTQVHVWQPPVMLPINWLQASAHDRLIRHNVNLLVKGLRAVMTQLTMHRPLVINGFNPVFGLPMLHQLNEAGTIYYCFDEITASDWMGRHGQRYEPDYLRQVDAVITTSDALCQSKAQLQPNAFCVKNGVNFDLFHQARLLADKQPVERPVVGYLGTADNRIDVALVEHCVRTMPDVLFRFVGEVNEPRLQQLSTYPNVEFIPPHQPHQLPALLAKMSVAIIPYVCNAHTNTIYPLKINEYLAAGLPVVSTPFSNLSDFDGIIDLAASPEAFADALGRALNDQEPASRDRRVATARANSWARRAEEFEAVIAQL